MGQGGVTTKVMIEGTLRVMNACDRNQPNVTVCNIEVLLIANQRERERVRCNSFKSRGSQKVGINMHACNAA